MPAVSSDSWKKGRSCKIHTWHSDTKINWIIYMLRKVAFIRREGASTRWKRRLSGGRTGTIRKFRLLFSHLQKLGKNRDTWNEEILVLWLLHHQRRVPTTVPDYHNNMVDWFVRVAWLHLCPRGSVLIDNSRNSRGAINPRVPLSHFHRGASHGWPARAINDAGGAVTKHRVRAMQRTIQRRADVVDEYMLPHRYTTCNRCLCAIGGIVST